MRVGSSGSHLALRPSSVTACLTICTRILAVVVVLVAGCTSGSVEPPPPPPSGCTAHYAAFRRPLEVAVLLDRSCAMQARFDGTMASGPTDPEGRWFAAVDALEAAGIDPTVSAWSLVMSPEEAASCTMSGELAIYPEPYSGELFTDVLEAAGESPFDVCAAGTSEVPIEAALGALNGSEDIGATNEPVIVVIAAGAPSCGSTAETLEEAAANTPFDLVVLSLAPDATAAPLLESLALPDEEGLRPGYVAVESAADLSTQLNEVLAARRSCTVDLVSDADIPVTDEEELRVWVDGELVPQDPEDGWVLSFDGGITFNGPICDGLRAGTISRIEASSGCDEHVCVAVDADDEGEGEESCDGLDNDCDMVVDESCG